jgi:hypothetical protein
MVQRVAIAPPQSRIGALTAAERAQVLAQSPQRGRYERPIDRESAYEMLLERNADTPLTPASKPSASAAEPTSAGGGLADMAGEFLGSVAGQAMKTAVRQAANQIGRELVRGLLGSLLGGKRR